MLHTCPRVKIVILKKMYSQVWNQLEESHIIEKNKNKNKINQIKKLKNANHHMTFTYNITHHHNPQIMSFLHTCTTAASSRVWILRSTLIRASTCCRSEPSMRLTSSSDMAEKLGGGRGGGMSGRGGGRMMKKGNKYDGRELYASTKHCLWRCIYMVGMARLFGCLVCSCVSWFGHIIFLWLLFIYSLFILFYYYYYYCYYFSFSFLQ